MQVDAVDSLITELTELPTGSEDPRIADCLARLWRAGESLTCTHHCGCGGRVIMRYLIDFDYSSGAGCDSSVRPVAAPYVSPGKLTLE